jgi:hypothetical protein
MREHYFFYGLDHDFFWKQKTLEEHKLMLIFINEKSLGRMRRKKENYPRITA